MLLEKKILAIIGLSFSIFFIATESKSQIVPDNSLPNNSNVVREGNVLEIQEGTNRGDNLFHSFQDFSVPSGLEASFNNAVNIKNIFTRVTSNSSSNINGLISTNGSANLFLINPNGIIFGENSQLNIGGSFLATTANTIEFNDGTTFNSIEPENSILTINFPIGLDFGNNPTSIADGSGLITVNGSGHSLDGRGSSNPTTRGEQEPNLSVLPSNSLSLIGKEIRFSGGILVSPSGNLDIGSIRQGKVEIASPSNNGGTWELNYNDAEVFGNITFANRSLLDSSSIPNVSQLGGGSITLQGSNILSRNGSVILNQNFGEGNSNPINISASDSFQISGTDPVALLPGGIRSEAISSGNGADINISTPQLSIIEGGSVHAFAFSPFSQTTSGNINLNVSDLRILGVSPRSAFTGSSIVTFTFSLSQAGNIFVNSETLLIEDGGTLGSSGFLGAVGNITVDATKSIVIKGFEPTLSISSSIFSTNSASPNPGSVNLSTPSLQIQNGANISTSTFAEGDAGNIFINTDNLEIVGQIPQSTFIDFDVPSNISSSTTTFNGELVETVPDRINFGNFVDSTLTGNSGTIEVRTNSLQLEDSGQIVVANFGSGNAGIIEINANSTSLNNGSVISASTLSGEGGNINVNTENLEALNQSQITASAGNEGNGGNINIDSNSILSLQNSDITANAIGGDGGNITINSNAILGLQERSQLTPFGDITATSDFGVDGNITINSPDIDFESEVFAALQFTTSQQPLELLKRRCLNPRRREGKLLYIGRGGVPANPTNFFDDQEIVAIDEVSGDNQKPTEPETQVWKEGDPIIESNKAITAANGDVYLVAETQLEPAKTNICHARSETD